MPTLHQAIQLIANHRDQANFAGPRSENAIARAEAALGFKFPPSYREFVARLGCGSIAGCEFYGLPTDEFSGSAIPNAVWVTLDERKSGFPVELLITGSTGYGSYYVLDSSRTREDLEYPVAEWEQGLSQCASELKIIAPDFAEFFLSEIRAALGVN